MCVCVRVRVCVCSLVYDCSILSIVSRFICLSVIFDGQTYLLGKNALRPICEKFEIRKKAYLVNEGLVDLTVE